LLFAFLGVQFLTANTWQQQIKAGKRMDIFLCSELDLREPSVPDLVFYEKMRGASNGRRRRSHTTEQWSLAHKEGSHYPMSIPWDSAPCCEWSAGGTEALSVAVETEEEEEEEEAHADEPKESTPATGAGEAPAEPQQPSLFQVNQCLLQAMSENEELRVAGPCIQLLR